MVSKVTQIDNLTDSNLNKNSEVTCATINYYMPPHIYQDAMSRKDLVEWLEAYQIENRGFKDQEVYTVVVPPLSAKILGTTTVTQ